MPLRYKEVQGELFAEEHNQLMTEQTQRLKPAASEPHALHAVAYPMDKVLLTVVGVLILNAICFAWGVERGKSVSLKQVIAQQHKAEPQPVETAFIAPQPALRVESVPAAVVSSPAPVELPQQLVEPPVPLIEPELPKEDAGYAVQLASYKTESAAVRELQRLNQRGHQGVLRKHGNFYVVYSTIFLEKKQAMQSLTAFRKLYKDCLVRKI